MDTSNQLLTKSHSGLCHTYDRQLIAQKMPFQDLSFKVSLLCGQIKQTHFLSEVFFTSICLLGDGEEF